MECNRDEALRAKTIAESKLEKKDFPGAKKFALKAQTLYPGLDGITQILTTVDVYVSAENKISGEVDWYGVLGVDPSADDEMVRKQYRKLALMLHPDKNKSVAADGAFKLISEAWSLLSDKTKRLAYNQRRGSRGFQQKVQLNTGGTSAPPKGNGAFTFANRTASVPKAQNTKAQHTPAPTPAANQRSDTFWTICHRCRMHYEYLKMYLNQTLLCPNCRQAFRASQTAPPHNYSKLAKNVPRQTQQTSSDRNAPVAQKSGPGQAGGNSFKYPVYQKDPISGTVNPGGRDPSIAVKAANVVQQAQEKLKRSYTESPSTGWEEFVKKKKVDDDNNRHRMNHNMAQGNGGFRTASWDPPGSRIYGFSGNDRQPNSTRDLTPLETRTMLMVKARKEIRNKLKVWKTAKSAVKVKNTNKEKRGQNGHVSNSADNEVKEDPPNATMTVPDPDFHDFDLDRAETSFGDNEVWAGYDDIDGMPRFYALINRVISKKPFKLKLSWLNSKTNTEFSSIDWVGSGFYKTCGEFRIGKYELCKSINSFSQKVNWSKGPRGSVLIFPQKGDVWALYKNWSPDWNKHTPDEVIHKYDMVTVLDDYNEEKGVSVAPLVKVLGFKTVFRPSLEQGEIKRIAKEEMFQFSHRVPFHLLTGEEAVNAPKGCLELDPAATPLELLQMGTEGDEVPNRTSADQENKPTC